jgi:hypothetical protein
MKTKKNKKLTLCVETLKILSEPNLLQVAGGETATHVCSTCNPCY